MDLIILVPLFAIVVTYFTPAGFLIASLPRKNVTPVKTGADICRLDVLTPLLG